METAAVLGKSQVAVQRALEDLRQALPFPLRGIDSDNGSEFINQPLWDYCQAQEIQFTRGRPYKKDDNAHIEQKNWTPVRKLLGYVRYDTPAAQAAIHALYRGELRLLQNLFLPSVKLLRKERVRARVRRRCVERTCGHIPLRISYRDKGEAHEARYQGSGGRQDPRSDYCCFESWCSCFAVAADTTDIPGGGRAEASESSG